MCAHTSWGSMTAPAQHPTAREKMAEEVKEIWHMVVNEQDMKWYISFADAQMGLMLSVWTINTRFRLLFSPNDCCWCHVKEQKSLSIVPCSSQCIVAPRISLDAFTLSSKSLHSRFHPSSLLHLADGMTQLISKLNQWFQWLMGERGDGAVVYTWSDQSWIHFLEIDPYSPLVCTLNVQDLTSASSQPTGAVHQHFGHVCDRGHNWGADKKEQWHSLIWFGNDTDVLSFFLDPTKVIRSGRCTCVILPFHSFGALYSL